MLSYLLIVLTQAAAGTPPAAPEVSLTHHHRAMCTVGVGDVFPSLADFPRGEHATVVAVATGGGWMTRQLLEDLPRDVCPAVRRAGCDGRRSRRDG